MLPNTERKKTPGGKMGIRSPPKYKIRRKCLVGEREDFRMFAVSMGYYPCICVVLFGWEVMAPCIGIFR